jgi:hypothetical protein
VIAGQSNAVGWSTQDRYTPHAAALAWTLWDELVPVIDPIHEQDWGSSPWPAFVDARALATGGRAVLLVPTASNGSCLVAPWTEGSEPTEPRWDPEAGDLYAKMVEQAREAIGPAGHVRAVLWHQGECEAWYASPVSAADYQAALEHLADRVMADLAAPLVAAPISTRPLPWAPSDAIQAIHDATLAAAAAHPSIFAGPDSDDLAHEPFGLHIHDVFELGLRWSRALNAARL